MFRDTNRMSGWLVALALSLALTACAPYASIQPAVAVANPPTSPEMVDAIDLAGKRVEVTYWHNRQPADQDFLQQLLDEFNRTNPYGITATAEIAGVSYPDVYERVNAAIQAGQPPEMSVAYQNQAATYRAQGAVIDLTPFIRSSTYGLSQQDLDDYFQPFLASDANPQFSNERLGFPTQRSMAVMYYNADWLRQAGSSDVPRDWTAWEELACRGSDPAQGRYGWAVQHDPSTFAALVFGRGGDILAADGQSYVFNSQAGVDSLAMMQRTFKNQCAVEVPAGERNGEQARFAAGNALFTFGSTTGLPSYQVAVASAGGFDWSIDMPPFNGEPAINLYGASVSVFKTTPEKELASWLVLRYLGETPQTVRWASRTGYLPVRQSAKQDVIASFASSPTMSSLASSYAKLFDFAPYARVESPVAGYDAVREIIDREVMTRVMTDFSTDPKAILDEAVAKANQILKDHAPRR